MAAGQIADNYRRIRAEIPPHVELVVAAKGRSPEEVAEAIEAGATAIGENYVQEAQSAVAALGQLAGRAQWHMIGHLQRNKVNKALPVFDVIQSVDSAALGRCLNERTDGPLRVYAEVNVGNESNKSGMPPGGLRGQLEALSQLENLRVEGLMTMAPFFDDPEQARPYFRRMKELFYQLHEVGLPNVDLKVLSMGMTDSYRVAIEEGANMVRVGTAIFGPRGR